MRVEFHLIAGWGLPHSKQTLNAGPPFSMGGPAGTFPGLWGGAISQTFGQAHALWDKKPAIEMSLLLPGLAPWRGDMTPFACVTQPLCCWCVAVFNPYFHFLTWVCSLAAMLRWYAVTKVSSATSVA